MTSDKIILKENPKILVISLPGVGDTLLATPSIKALKERYKNSIIDVFVMFKPSMEILTGNPYINEVLFFNILKEGTYRTIKYVLNLRKRKYDASILIYPGNRREYNIISWLIGAKYRLAHRYNHEHGFTCSWLNTDTILENNDLHNIQEDYALMEMLDAIPEKDEKPRIYMNDADYSKAQDWINQNIKENHKMLIGFHLGTAEFKNQKMRRWDYRKFAELGKRLNEKYNASILIFGGSNEKELKTSCKELMEAFAYDIETDNIIDTAALISKCNLFISNDSALMHISAALNVPTVAIFGPTNPTWVKPYNCKHVIASRKNLDCMPCFYYSIKPLTCRKYGDFRCIKDLEVDIIFNAADELITS